VIADDDAAFNVDQSRTGETAVRAHRQHDGVGFIIDRDPGRAWPFVDGVTVRVVDEFAAAADCNAAFPKAQGSDGSGIFIKAAEDYAGFAWSGEFFFSFWGETDQILEAGHKAFAHATRGRSAQFETTARGDGGGIV